MEKLTIAKLRIWGITRRTVLVPITFLLYIKIDSAIVLFADDTTIVVENNTWQEIKHRISKNLRTLNDWRKNTLTNN